MKTLLTTVLSWLTNLPWRKIGQIFDTVYEVTREMETWDKIPSAEKFMNVFKAVRPLLPLEVQVDEARAKGIIELLVRVSLTLLRIKK